MPKSRKSLAGRPSVITSETVRMIVGSLSRGSSVRAACRYAGISHESYYAHIRDSGQFKDFLIRAESVAGDVARMIIVDNLARGNVKTAKWYLNRYCKEEWGLK